MFSLVLASGSPRRRRLLASAGVEFEVQPADVDETRAPGETPREYSRRMAEAKCRAVSRGRRAGGDRRPVLGADTIVVLDGEVMGKPADREQARLMLRRLSGRTHRVVTGFCIEGPGGALVQREVVSEVRFKELREAELGAYLETGEWSDKAGAYAIQGRAAFMVQAVVGSYTNVVGLPLAEVVEALHGIAESAEEGADELAG
jgi:septum formation protein